MSMCLLGTLEQFLTISSTILIIFYSNFILFHGERSSNCLFENVQYFGNFHVQILWLQSHFFDTKPFLDFKPDPSGPCMSSLNPFGSVTGPRGTELILGNFKIFWATSKVTQIPKFEIICICCYGGFKKT